MPEFLVTVCGDEHYGFGPACVVEAEDADEAARKGLELMRAEDSGVSQPYGVECGECERLAVPSVHVLAMASAHRYTVEQVVKADG